MKTTLAKGSGIIFAELSRHPLAFELTGRINGLTLQLLMATDRLEKPCWHKPEFRAVRMFAENQVRLVEQQLDAQRQEQTLAERNAELRSLQAEQQELVNLVVHNMSSPVSAVRLVLDLLDRDANTLTAMQRDERHRIADESLDYLQDVLAQLRWIYDADGVNQFAEETVELAPLLESVAFEHRGLAEDKGQTVELHFDESVAVDADPLAVRQIVGNLLSNAIKFSPYETSIDLDLGVDGAQNALVTVRDQGPGIQSHEQKLLFKRYGRLSAQPTNGEASTGLGLYVAQRLAQQMNGEVRWEPGVDGIGSEFTLQIPMSDAECIGEEQLLQASA